MTVNYQLFFFWRMSGGAVLSRADILENIEQGFVFSVHQEYTNYRSDLLF